MFDFQSINNVCIILFCLFALFGSLIFLANGYQGGSMTPEHATQRVKDASFWVSEKQFSPIDFIETVEKFSDDEKVSFIIHSNVLKDPKERAAYAFFLNRKDISKLIQVLKAHQRSNHENANPTPEPRDEGSVEQNP